MRVQPGAKSKGIVPRPAQNVINEKKPRYSRGDLHKLVRFLREKHPSILKEYNASRSLVSPEAIIATYVRHYCGIWHYYNGSLRKIRFQKALILKEFLEDFNRKVRDGTYRFFDTDGEGGEIHLYPSKAIEEASKQKTPSGFAEVSTAIELGIKRQRVRDVMKKSYGSKNPQIAAFRKTIFDHFRQSGVARDREVMSVVNLLAIAPIGKRKRTEIRRFLRVS